MTIINFYFIRHIPTGYYLRKGHYSTRGASYHEPAPFSDKTRIYYSLKSAERVLSCWLKGKYESDGGGDEGTYWTGKIIPVKSRIREDMEIIRREIDL